MFEDHWKGLLKRGFLWQMRNIVQALNGSCGCVKRTLFLRSSVWNDHGWAELKQDMSAHKKTIMGAWGVYVSLHVIGFVYVHLHWREQDPVHVQHKHKAFTQWEQTAKTYPEHHCTLVVIAGISSQIYSNYNTDVPDVFWFVFLVQCIIYNKIHF